MPVCLVKASIVGRRWVLSSTSMYSGQFDQLTTLSVSDRSVGAALAVGVPPPAAARPLEPQAASAATAATPAALLIRVRRETSPRASAAVSSGGRGFCSFMPLLLRVLTVSRRCWP